jgi:hypothetical protein
LSILVVVATGLTVSGLVALETGIHFQRAEVAQMGTGENPITEKEHGTDPHTLCAVGPTEPYDIVIEPIAPSILRFRPPSALPSRGGRP